MKLIIDLDLPEDALIDEVLNEIEENLSCDFDVNSIHFEEDYNGN